MAGEQLHQSDPSILGRRTLEQDHSGLLPFLKEGQSVLDAGCGVGAIAVGIAKRIGPHGKAVGIDRDAGLIEIARTNHAAQSNLEFLTLDLTALPFTEEFDIATASRTLQWIANPARAIAQLTRALRPGGALVVLDYNHEDNSWQPAPPAPFAHFYQAFLAWRASHGWDNRMAEHLPELFLQAGLESIHTTPQDERSSPGSPNSRLWLEVIHNVGATIVSEGFLKQRDLDTAQSAYATWLETEMQWQHLSLACSTGRKPLAGPLA